MLLATITAFAFGWMAGRYELRRYAACLLGELKEWALRKDATVRKDVAGQRDLVWWLAAAPIMAVALFVAHPVAGPRAYRRTRRARRVAARPVR
ncbi:hypothetical protein WKI65_44160 [Streptomyces sp. MS1.AVA.3]|uniref:hypothetical protein n=1 Tax=Streptomyces decoyicus TaxID=249567 RepID=UPI0030BF82F2